MPSIELHLCPFCYGLARQVTTTPDEVIAGKITPCQCGSGLEAITEDGEILPVGKLSHHGQEAKDQTTPPAS